MSEHIIKIDNPALLQALFGEYDENIKTIEDKYGVVLVCRNESVKICGDEPGAEYARNSLLSLIKMYENGNDITNQSVRYAASLEDKKQLDELSLLGSSVICITVSGRPVRPRTIGQKNYIDAIKNNTVVFGIGPAGTGKTYLAVAMAVKAFRSNKVSKIILTRPAVEAGESLGFLPGDLQEKVDPYLRPLYDALFDMFGKENFASLKERGAIEVAPLAYMRGRTLEDSFIILDEAQNTTPEQLKMFLTRLGCRSRMVITGDITQIDLPNSKKSGLPEAIRILKNIDDIEIHKFSEKDVVRHKLVQDIIAAYESCGSTKGDY